VSEITYKTIAAPSEAQYRVLGSRHISYAYPVVTEDQIKTIIDQLWKEHHSATHVCYAWRLGWEKKHYRINDDGEPGGTAGKPIFGQIQSFDLTNILIAVVRYYGGTKLGTSGLIDAYKTAAKLSIEAATVAEHEVQDVYEFTFNHEHMPRAMKALKEMHMNKISSVLDLKCVLEFSIRKSQQKKMEELAADIPDSLLVYKGTL
jgi:uncharacterized YigZ family protein